MKIKIVITITKNTNIKNVNIIYFTFDYIINNDGIYY